ncbi:hypothetical protein C8J56DRAFT_973162 [Mycena floridula]|nr:hypothetical protein C8J56DRAFT_973162 [Mycena floridula]
MSPALWSTIGNQRHTEAFLRRSRSAPFSFTMILHDPVKLSARTLDLLLDHRPRLSQLHFNISDDPTYLNHRFLTHSLPELFSLTIWPLEPAGDTALPPHFAGRMPKLRQVTLRHFTSWPTGYFHNLTHLCLYAQTAPTARASTAEFLGFIENSPYLEVLTLSEAVFNYLYLNQI